MFIVIVSRGFPTIQYPLNGIFEFDQAKALANYGHKVVYVALDLRSFRRKRKFGLQRLEKEGVEVWNYNFPLGNLPRGLLKSMGKRAFAKLYKKIVKEHGKPDLVHAHFWDIASYVGAYCKKREVPFVITEHSSLVNKPILEQKFANRLKGIYGNASALIAVGSALAKNMQKHTGASAIIVHNIVDVSGFSVREEGAATDKATFISAGNLVKSKGFDITLKAFAKCKERFGDARLIIMGGGVEEENLKALAKTLGVTDSVTFTGKYQRGDFAQALKGSDVFVLASRSETFGVVYVEAMAAGLPVIATRCGGPEDFVDETNGVLVDVDDVEQLAQAMERIYLDKKAYDNKKIRERTVGKFAPQSIAERLTKTYQEIV